MHNKYLMNNIKVHHYRYDIKNSGIGLDVRLVACDAEGSRYIAGCLEAYHVSHVKTNGC